ncbi:MAG: amidohydrolase family protein, partial [Gemmatimonadota bacterium]
LIAAGVDGFLHGRLGPDPFLRDAVRSGVADRLLERPEATPGPESREAELAAALGRLLEAGATIVLGTDAGAIPDHFFGYTGHRELEILVRLGMTPMQALVAGTGAAAAALHLEDTGALAPGFRADFVVLGADPLEDIRNTRRIEAVYLGGQRVDREGLRAGWTDAR